MGKYLDIAQRVRDQQEIQNTIDGHRVQEIVWETPKIIVFRDFEGKVWRRVHAWGMTWPVEVKQ
jgi:hypothetical protein